MPIVLDNNKIGAVGEYVKENTHEGANITISSPILQFMLLKSCEKYSKKVINSIFFLMNLHLLNVLLPMIKKLKNLNYRCIKGKEMFLNLI